jgi:hypothetical protein
LYRGIGNAGKGTLDKLLDRAARPYGVSVRVSDEFKERWRHDFWLSDKPLWAEPEPWTGLWAGAPFTTAGDEPWKREDGDSRWYWPDWPNERHDPEHMRALAEEAERQGIDPARPAVDPVIHTLLTGIVHGRQLVAETEDLTSLPPAPGMTPTAHQRLARVAPLNRLAVAVLEDALRPGSLTADRFAAELASVVKPSGLVITT